MSVSVQTGNMRDLADQVVRSSESFMTQITLIKNEINTNLASHWTGAEFDAFRDLFNQKHARCETLKSDIETKATKLYETADAGDDLSVGISKMF